MVENPNEMAHILTLYMVRSLFPNF